MNNEFIQMKNEFSKNTFLDQQPVKIIRKDYFSLTSGKAIYNKVKLNFYFVYANQ